MVQLKNCSFGIKQQPFTHYYLLYLQDGQQFGDEYLAELDYIEVVERQKEGYESDVDMDEGLGDGSDEDDVDDSDEEGANLSHNDSDR